MPEEYPEEYEELRELVAAVLLPFQCSPGQGRGAAGDPCLSAQDCSSGACESEGVLRRCMAGGQLCETDADCELFGCIELGALDGHCR